MDNKSEQPKKIGATRRGFLKKSTASVVIASIPARSVWGACTVSGALSGNASKISDDCTVIPPLVGGRSPGGWQSALADNNLHDMFSYIKFKKKCSTAQYDGARSFLIQQIEAKLADNISLGAGLSFNVGDGLGKNVDMTAFSNAGINTSSLKGLFYNLAAVYLNVAFLFYDVPAVSMSDGDITTAEELIAHMFAVHIANNGIYLSGNSVFGFTNGISDYNPETGTTTPPTSC